MGRISGEVTAGGGTVRETARGFGDPMLELDVNLIGRPAQKNLVDALRYAAGVLPRPDRRPGGAGRRVRQHPDAEPRPEPVVRARGRAHRLAARPVGAGPAHDPGAPARRLALRDERRLRRADAQHRSDVPGGRAPDARLHRAPLGRRSTAPGTRAERPRSTASRARSSTTWESESPSGTRSTTTWASPWATSRRSTTSAPGDLQMDGFMVSLVAGWHPLVEGARRLKGE